MPSQNNFNIVIQNIDSCIIVNVFNLLEKKLWRQWGYTFSIISCWVQNTILIIIQIFSIKSKVQSYFNNKNLLNYAVLSTKCNGFQTSFCTQMSELAKLFSLFLHDGLDLAFVEECLYFYT